MDQKTASEAEHALRKLNEMIDAGQILNFTPAEAKALKEVALIWMQIVGAVSLGGRIGSVLKWVVIVGASWAAIKAGLLDWLRAGLER